MRHDLTLALRVVLLIPIIALSSCGGPSKPAGKPAPANVAKVLEFFLTEELDGFDKRNPPGAAFVTADGAAIKSVVFARAYGFHDSANRPVMVEGVTIYERVYVHLWKTSDAEFNKEAEVTKANTATSSNQGTFADKLTLARRSIGLPSSFDVQLTRIFYVKNDGLKIPIGANFYQYKRDEGDGKDAVMKKSVMQPVYYPSNLDPPADKPKPFVIRDSGEPPLP